ncbi:hypothetical protein M422DRAFT_257348 [Sphaerobolus stellatus SS14]|uniref:Uncharacterized protein n=1 Tax=Sphaerobolus stellatus (strain SS14) TaxID=990650 RepID=A0A0C9VNT6_SPHS4|nr:hypothetical protein M422DRAFT_257348 [Sphaerobolus stellatus SS14]
MSIQQQQKVQEDEIIKRTGEISTKIREVVNFNDYKVEETSVILPLETELNQAILCDDMPTLSPLQLGPTGRSVARSYGNAISKLVPAGTTVGIDEGKPITDDQKRYKQAMKFLSSEVPEKPGQSVVELYVSKQAKYTNAVSEKTRTLQEALKRAQDDPMNRTQKQVREAYDKWVPENAHTYRNYVQAAYMDWVITGRKEEVEYWFSVVDQDSALAREVMRWAVVQDVDGSCEYQKVKLEPSDWANKCLQKMNSGTDKTKTPEWYTWEISRLEKTNAMLAGLKSSPAPYVDIQSPNDDKVKEAKDKLGAAMREFSEARRNVLQASSKKESSNKVIANGASKDPDLAGKGASGTETEAEKKARQDLETRYSNAQMALQDAQRFYDKFNLARLTSENKNAENKLFSEIIKDNGIIGREITNSEHQENGRRNLALRHAEETSEWTLGYQNDTDKQIKTSQQPPPHHPVRSIASVAFASFPDEALIKQYEKEWDALLNGGQKPQDKALEGLAESMGIPKALPDPTLAPPPAQKPLEDFFTPITVELSSSSETTATQTSASTFSAGATASWGIASVSASVDHSEAHTSAMKELVSSNVKVSFECMRVDITRPWLRPELFYDEDLVPGPGINWVITETFTLSFTRLRELMESQGPNAQSELAMYSTFPLYPTAFLVACNVVLEISGSTSSLQTHMNSSNTSASLSVGYGPFSSNASGSHSSSNAGSHCQTTASGCRIEIKAPQIIGWISQMVPALPRISQPAQPNAVVLTTQTGA